MGHAAVAVSSIEVIYMEDVLTCSTVPNCSSWQHLLFRDGNKISSEEEEEYSHENSSRCFKLSLRVLAINHAPDKLLPSFETVGLFLRKGFFLFEVCR
jgi:hypothetical protein